MTLLLEIYLAVVIVTCKLHRKSNRYFAGQSSLSTLDFSLNVSDGIALEMEQLPELKHVKTLLLKKCRVNPVSVIELSKFIATTTSSFPQISSLTLDGIKLSGTGTLNGMLGLSDTFIPTIPCGLELLSLTGCVLNDRDVKPLLTALGNGLVVKELRLSANRLMDTTVNYLVDSGGTSLSLRALDLSINKVCLELTKIIPRQSILLCLILYLMASRKVDSQTILE